MKLRSSFHKRQTASSSAVSQTLEYPVLQVIGRTLRRGYRRNVFLTGSSSRSSLHLVTALPWHTIKQIVGVSDRQGIHETDDFVVAIYPVPQMWKEVFEMTQHCVVEHVCMRAEPANQQNAQGPFHKTVCVKVQSIKSRRVAQMMSFWDFKISLKYTEGAHFSRWVLAGTARWRRRLGS